VEQVDGYVQYHSSGHRGEHCIVVDSNPVVAPRRRAQVIDRSIRDDIGLFPVGIGQTLTSAPMVRMPPVRSLVATGVEVMIAVPVTVVVVVMPVATLMPVVTLIVSAIMVVFRGVGESQ